MTDYSLWEVILNGNKVLKRTVGEVEQEYEPTSAEEKQDRRNKMKARGTLLMALPNKDQLKFHSYKDAKLLMEAIEKRSLPSEWKTHALIWNNKEEIKTISLDDLYNNLKIYEPELTGSSSTSQNPQNVAFVSSNNTNSNNNSSTNKVDNTTYGVSATHTQCNPTSRDNLSDVMICAFLASQPNSPQLAREDLEQIDPDDLEEMDLQWEMAMLTIRARRFIKMTDRKLDVNGQRVRFDMSKVECYNCHKNGHFARECRAPRNQENRGRENSRRTVWKLPLKIPWLLKMELEDMIGATKLKKSILQTLHLWHIHLQEVLLIQILRLAHYKKKEAVFEESINVLNLEVKLRDNALDENKKKLEKAENERDELKLTLEKFQNSSKSLNNLLESQVIDKFKTRLGYNTSSSIAASPIVESFVNSYDMLENQENNKSKSDKGYYEVPLPYTGNFIPFKPDLTFMDEIVEIEPKTVRKNSFRPPIIEDWNSDDDSKVEFIPNVKDKTVRPSTEKIKFIKGSFVIGLEYSKEYVSLPDHEAVKDAIAILGLSNDKESEASSKDLAHSSPLRLRYFSQTWKGLNIDIAGILYDDLISKLTAGGKKGREKNICYTNIYLLS
ncbi:putative ribonuclease H-like domain-containing protein [Tanacetum coccineum]